VKQPPANDSVAAKSDANETALTVRSAEIGVALLTAALGALVMFDSYAQGIGWNDSGPEAGYFPFRVGLLMLLASVGTIGFALKHWVVLAEPLVARGPMRRVLTVFLPMCVYAIGIRWLGMYIASTLFIGWFMWRERDDGRHSFAKIAAVSIGTTAACWVIFEVWFKVPMYAGPVFKYLGLAH
jgi:hypothetical protein